MKSTYSLAVLLFLLVFGGCKKAIDVKIPAGVFTTKTIFASATSAQAAMRGIYQTMTNVFSTTPFEATLTGNLGLNADELLRPNYSTEQQQFLDNNLNPDNGTIAGVWLAFYSYIYQANLLAESVEQSPSLSPAVKDELIGEARFIRALSFFYLTNLFNKVPVVLTSDYANNAVLPVSEQSVVYQQIIADLQYAQTRVGDKNPVAGTRFRANKWAATALLARVYLYQRQWAKAEAEATAVIAQNTVYKLESLDNVFLASSTETIWALANPGVNLYATEGTSISGSSASNTAFRMSPYLLSRFEAGDARLTSWGRVGGGVTAPFKFKVYSNTQPGAKKEAPNLLRLAEQYLIRAEARAMQDNLTGAIADLDVVRIRAGAVANTTKAFQTVGFSNPNIGKGDLIKAILNERLLELFAEFGHRWLDAKRIAPDNLSLFFEDRKGTIKTTAAYYPLPSREIVYNPNLKQNDGY